MKRIPARYLFVAIAAAVFLWAAVAEYQASPPPPVSPYSLQSAPPPPIPVIELVAIFLGIPGALAGLPIAAIAAVFTQDMPIYPAIVTSALACGALFFWYGVGSYVDDSRGMLKDSAPPKAVSHYFQFLIYASFPSCAFLVYAGLNHHGWYLSDAFTYGLLMFWPTLGVFFGVRQIREERATRKDTATKIDLSTSPDDHSL